MIEIILLVLIAYFSVIGCFVNGAFLTRQLLRYLDAKKGYTTVSMKQLVNLVEERNAYRYALKHGISLEEVEQTISEDGK